VCFVDQGLSGSAVDARKADVESSAEEVIAIGDVPIPAGKAVFRFRAARTIALSKQADQAAANSCSGLVPIRAEPGVENLISRRPSQLREAPFSRPPEVRVLPVCRTFETRLIVLP
jgi:hypothetical protein